MPFFLMSIKVYEIDMHKKIVKRNHNFKSDFKYHKLCLQKT